MSSTAPSRDRTQPPRQPWYKAQLSLATSQLFPHDFYGFTVSTNNAIPDPPPHVEIFALRGGSGPPLLLLHGYPQTHLIWHKIIPALREHYTLIIPDLRGYGRSSKPRRKDDADADDHSWYAKSAMAEDLVVVMDQLGYKDEPFYVLGHDRGGRVAHAMCVNHPSRVKKAMLLDIVPTLAMFNATDKMLATAYWHWFFLSQARPFPEDAILAAPQAFAEKQLTRMLAASGRKREDVFVDAAWEEYCKLFTDADTVHGMCEDYRAGAKEDCEEQERNLEEERKIQCKIRVLWGKDGVCEKGFDVKKEWEKVSKDGCWDERGEAVPGGHYIPEEQPEILTRHALEFFKD